jgi:hypothetical protein
MNNYAIFRSQAGLVLFAVILLSVLSGESDGQESQNRLPDLSTFQKRLKEARATYAAKNYVEAAALYRNLAENNPKDGENWLRLAQCRYRLKEYRPAIESLCRANEIGFGRLQDNDIEIARAYAYLGDKENSLEWLARGLNVHRFELRPRLQEDRAFHAFRSDAKFRELAGLLPDRQFTREEGWRYDLDYLLAEIQRLNATYSHQPLPEPVRQAADRLRERIATLSDVEIALEMQRLLALLVCSHNTLLPVPGSRVSFTYLPVTYYIFSDGLYLIDAEGEAKALVGARIVRFDDTDAADVVRAVRTLARRENDMEALWLAPSYLTLPQVLHILGFIKNPDKVRLTARRDMGEETITIVPGRPLRSRKLIPSRMPGAPAAPMYLEKVADAYWFKYLPEKETVYFQFNQIMDKEGEPLSAFARRLQQFLGEHKTQNLMVDLRHNNGGNTFLYNELVRTIVHFDASGVNRKLFVLIGRNTYSAAVNFAVDLERLTRAVFVGEPTGGKPNTHGDESPTVLPYSRLRFLLSSVYWQLSSPRDSRLWIPASIPVPLSAQDYFANRDPVLESVLKLCSPGG